MPASLQPTRPAAPADTPDTPRVASSTWKQLRLLCNSSFSWWGAWLNQTARPLVIAPKHWLGFASGADEPAKVLPERWITLPVRDPPFRRNDEPAVVSKTP